MATSDRPGKAAFRILVVEDNPLIRESIRIAVQRLTDQHGERSLKFEVNEAEDGQKAVGLLKQFSFDLVIADLYLPVLSGLDLIEQLRNDPASSATPILAISASIEDARARSLGAGADMFLQKPLRLVDVVDAVSQLLKIN